MKLVWEEKGMISFICFVIGLCAVPGPLKRRTGELMLAPAWHLQPAELFPTLLNKNIRKTFELLNLGTIEPSRMRGQLNIFSKFFTRHSAPCTLHISFSQAERNSLNFHRGPSISETLMSQVRKGVFRLWAEKSPLKSKRASRNLKTCLKTRRPASVFAAQCTQRRSASGCWPLAGRPGTRHLLPGTQNFFFCTQHSALIL